MCIFKKLEEEQSSKQENCVS